MIGKQSVKSDRTLIIEANLVEHERLNGEVIVISFKSGKYFSLSGSAADIWTLCTNSMSQASMVSVLQEKWNTAIDIQEQVSNFIDECVASEIIKEIEGSESTLITLPNDFERNGWQAPNLMVFGNLQDLIMVDPVHDASLIDWPVEKDFEFDK